MPKIYWLLIIVLFISIQNCQEKIEDTNASNYLLNEIPNTKTGIDFKNTLNEDVDHNIINYIYFYNGGGVSAGDINNDGLPDLYFVSNRGENKLYLNKGNLEFEDITKKANVSGTSDWNTGSTMVDVNGDGFLDIYVCAVTKLLGFKGHNELFINNGDGTFTEKSKEYGLNIEGYSTQAYFFDYDKDDDLDVYIVNHAVHTTISHGEASLRNNRAPLVGDILMKNNNGKFEDVSEEANIYGGINGYGLSASIADFNNDGWDDIYVCNDFHEDDYYYINNQDGTFREELKKSFSTISRFSMGSDAADINGNGFQDLVALDMLPSDERVLKETEGDDAMYLMRENLKQKGYKDQYARNMLQINEGGKYFYETALFNNVEDTDWSWSPLFADFNNDGFQDLFISNGIKRRPNDLDFKKYVSNSFKTKNQKESLDHLYQSINEMPSGKVSNEIFEGNAIKFSNKTGKWIENKPSLSNGATYADLDLDGDLDIITNNIDDFATIYENTTNSNKNYLNFEFKYKGKNLKGVGTKVLLFSKGKKQFKQLHTSRGFCSSTETKIYFGLDTSSLIDSIVVIWPDNSYQKINNTPINQTRSITYQESGNKYNYLVNSKSNHEFYLNDMLPFKHEEDDYYDFNLEKIIPYQVSKLGPAIAIGDIDGNGFDDVFLGNGSGYKASVFMNDGKSFKKSIQKHIDEDAFFEDNDAAFFDADNDGDLDLYVSSGINISRNKNFEIDRLYINNNGVFEKSVKKTLINPLNTSCVAPYDYDNDGDIDLFIGNLSNPDHFGSTVNSAMLINDGKGNFKADLTFTLKSFVTSATWIDINNDNQKDLLVATEWDTPKIYINNNGKLSLLEMPKNLNGLWQTITAFDIDLDGDKDILLGNWGLNTKFNPTKENKLVMYYADFDNNYTKETVIAYTINGKEYPVNSKDELASQINDIRKRFVEHKNYALKTVDQVLTAEAIKKAKKYEVATLASGYLENSNGSFKTFKELPDKFQFAPIKSFNQIIFNNQDAIIVSGNSLSMNSYHGGYTSLKGILLKSLTDYNWVSNYGIEPFNSQIKGIKSIKMKDGYVLLVASNNDNLKTYYYKN